MLNARAPSTYKYIRSAGVVNLPSQDTLQSYTGRYTGAVGFGPLVKKRLEALASDLSAIEKVVSLAVDETTIAPGEQYDRTTQQLIGAVDMGGIVPNSSKQNEDGTIEEESPREANKVLAFEITGLTKYYKVPVAFYFVRELKAEELIALALEVIKQLEALGFKVFRLVSDNLSTNRKMFTLMHDGSLCNVVRHPVQAGATEEEKRDYGFRPLFLCFDYCHVLKNVKHQFIYRDFHINNQMATAKFVNKLFKKQSSDLLKPVRGLARKHIFPTSIEKQTVKPAMDVFRSDLTATIRLHAELGTEGFEDVDSTLKFMENMQRWIAIHDISSTKEHILKRLPDKKPFYSEEDERLDFLEKKFCRWLEKWKQEVEEGLNKIPQVNKDMTQEEKARIAQLKKKQKHRGLTKETHEALLFTTKSTVDSVRFLIRVYGFAFLLTRRFSSDEIEQLFGTARQMVGGNFKLDARSWTYSFEKILSYGIAFASIDGNVRLTREKTSTISTDSRKFAISYISSQ